LIHPGDFIFGDPDGVIVIPHRLGESVCALAEKRLDREDQVRRELMATDDVEELYQRIGRW
jgi:regulator of RNase E activity RraA